MAGRQFSLAHLTALDATPPDLVRAAGSAGYEFVGLRLMPLGLRAESRADIVHDLALRRETRRALVETDVRVLDVELARISNDVAPEDYVPAFEAAAEVGASHILSSIWTSDAAVVQEAFGRVCELAAPFELTVDLEFVAWGDCSTLAGAVEVLRTADRPNAGLMIDTFHFHQAGTALSELDTIPPAWCHYVHVSDDRSGRPDTVEACKRRGREGRLYPGEGEIDIAAILRRLPGDVVCALEIPNLERRRQLGTETYVRECLERTRRYLATGDEQGGVR